MQNCLNHYHSTPVSHSSPASGDAMFNQWYYQVGYSAIQVIVKAYFASSLHHVQHVLDLPCGYGRVLRHLVNLFPEAKIHASDLDVGAVDFCKSEFGVHGIYSVEELTKTELPIKYDLIWVGSLFTHTSLKVTRRWMAYLASHLSPTGIIIATFHGRWNEKVHTVAPYVQQSNWEKVLNGYHSVGFGYVDYEREENHPFIQGSYGVSLALPHVIVKEIEAISGVRVYMYVERGWSDVQDVVVFGKPDVFKKWPGM